MTSLASVTPLLYCSASYLQMFTMPVRQKKTQKRKDRAVYVLDVPDSTWPTSVDACGQQLAAQAIGNEESSTPEDEEEEATLDRRYPTRSGKHPVQEGPADMKRKKGAATPSHPRGGVQLKEPPARR